MVEWAKRQMERPWVAHLLRAVQRFNGRLGNQFGAALAYFSVLAVVPILMLAFGITGFVLDQRPDLLEIVKEEATKAVSEGGDAGDKLGGLIEETLSNYWSVFGVGLLTALYAGTGWVGNLKSAIRAQWRPKFDMTESKRNIVVERLINAGQLFALILMIMITFALASAGTSLNNLIVDLLGLHDVPGIWVVLRFGPVVLSAAAGWLLFMFMFWVFPQYPVPLRARVKGALIAAIGLGLLQYGAAALFGVFARNAAASIFGPAIALMLFLNLFARLTLFVAAWIATTEQPAFDLSENDYRFDPYSPVHGPSLPPPLLRLQSLGSSRHRRLGSDEEPPELESGRDQPWVPQPIAVRSVRAGLGAGWLTGVATGAGLGAMVAGVAARLGRRRVKD